MNKILTRKEWLASLKELVDSCNQKANEQEKPVAWLYPGSETEAKHVCLDEDIFEEQKQNCIPLCIAPPPRKPEQAQCAPTTALTEAEVRRIVREELERFELVDRKDPR